LSFTLKLFTNLEAAYEGLDDEIKQRILGYRGIMRFDRTK
jgi:hypothetical protein